MSGKAPNFFLIECCLRKMVENTPKFLDTFKKKVNLKDKLSTQQTQFIQNLT